MAWEPPEVQVHATEDEATADRGVAAELQWALEALIERSEISADTALKVGTSILAAPAKVALANAASRAGLLVLGAPQHAAAFAALSARRRIVTYAPCPIAIVPAAGNQFNAAVPGDRFVVGMDGSVQSVAALEWACAEASRRGLPVRVLSVGLQDAMPARIEQAVAVQQAAPQATDIALTTHTGDPAEVLSQASSGAEALVLGQHGNGWLSHRLPSRGSVSRWCAAHPVCAVVVVPLP